MKKIILISSALLLLGALPAKADSFSLSIGSDPYPSGYYYVAPSPYYYAEPVPIYTGGYYRVAPYYYDRHRHYNWKYWKHRHADRDHDRGRHYGWRR